MRFDFSFSKNYEVRVLASVPPVHPVERLHHYPVELEEGDRSGTYVRVVPQSGPAWTGFFAQGFDSNQVLSAVCSCPDADSVCVIAGGYAYIVKTNKPEEWLRIEQRPVVDILVATRQQLILFIGFTSITALGREGVTWSTARLSWEGLSITGSEGGTLRGKGWDALSDQEVQFEVDLETGKHTGGARPSS